MLIDKVRSWISDPHPASERFDSDFFVTYHCKRCGRFGHGPRSQLREAVLEHWESPACRRLGDGAGDMMMRLYYPKV